MKFIKNFGTIALSDTISGALGSIFWLYLASLLTASNYGELQFLISIAALAAGFSQIANSNTLIVFEAKQRDLRKTLYFISFAIGIIASLVLFILYTRFDIILLIFGTMISEMTASYFLGKKLLIKYGISLILQKILMITLAIVLYFFIGIEGIIYGIGLSYTPLAIIVFNSVKESAFNLSSFKKNFGFILNNYGTRLIILSRRNLDKIIIAPVLGFEILGEYALAIQVYTVMILFSTISFKFLLYTDASGINSTKFKVIVMLIAILFSILGIVFGPYAIPILFPNFIDTLEIIPIVSLSVIPNTIILIYSSKFLANEKSRFTLVGTITYTVIYLLLVLILGPLYGLFGLCMSFLIGSTVYATFLVVMHKIQKFN